MNETNRAVAVGSAAPTGIGDMLFSSRSYREYRAMFALTDGELAGRRVLDCPSGAAGFTAVAAADGVDARACDPAYTEGADDLAARSSADFVRASGYVRHHPDEYAWSFFTDFDAYSTEREASRARFVADYAAHPERYLAARLPRLPFQDGTFDFVLCSHLLFSWADRLDLGFHDAAIGELARVGATVRIFPLFAMGAGPALELDPLLARLHRRGLATRLRPVDYEFQRGDPVMLEVRHRGGGRAASDDVTVAGPADRPTLGA